MKSLLINKKGGTLSKWTEGVSFMLLFILLFASFTIYMNAKYEKDYQLEGLDTSNIEDNLRNKTSSIQNDKFN